MSDTPRSETDRTDQPPDPADDGVTVAVTGAAGFVGSRVITRLRERHPDWGVIALDNFYRGELESVSGVPVADVDVRDRSALESTLSGADVVIHLAALSGVDDCTDHPDLAYEVNVTGTANVAWFCRKHTTGLVFPFSMAVLGDPEEFPVTTDHDRDPITWYGRTKLLGERTVRTMADGSFPAHLLMLSNVYGEHEVGGQRITKGTVINLFVDRVCDGDALTVYEPGTQARNYVHVDDVARAYLASVERLVGQTTRGVDAVETYAVASPEDPDVTTLARTVRRVGREELGHDVAVEHVENPRDEATVESFPVDTERTRDRLDWSADERIEGAVREMIRSRMAAEAEVRE